MKNYEESPSEVNRTSDKKKKMELEWSHITQRKWSDRESCIRLESSGKWKER